MSETATSAPETPNAGGADKRRSTRVVRAVPIIVIGTDALGQPFRESTSTIVVDCFGCKFQSQNYVPRNSTVTVEIFHAPGWDRRVIRGRVVWLQRPRSHREKYQIAVEMDVPGNVWGVSPPPSDWFPHPDDIGQAPIEVLDPVSSDAQSGLAEGAGRDIEIENPSDASNSPSAAIAPAEPEEITFTREQLDGELREAIGKTLHSVIEKAARDAVRDLVEDVADRSSEIVEAARRISQETAEEVDAKLRSALDEAVKSLRIDIPKSLAPKQRRRRPTKRDE
ncbi:MAG: hypothetical protein KGL02_02270 [Acidobacteriota bacterium]|nr:hypothetical protein [Acidobacteriota bacterium]